jgi:hypothetical protein
VDQQVTAAFSLAQRRFRRLEGEVGGDVQRQCQQRRVGNVAC